AITRNVLESEGWVVTEAENGEVALACLEERRPSLILLDIIMPVMDGFAFAERMRQRPEWRSIPIVVLTGKDLESEERRRLRGYVETILTKSGDSREALLNRVRDLLEDCGVPRKAPGSPPDGMKVV